MKNLLFLLIAFSISTFSCFSQTKAETNQKIAVNTIELTKTSFLKKIVDYENNPKEWKYLGDKPALVDFYASWCGPCKQIAPVLEELAKKYEGQIYIYKVNTDKEQEIAALFGIRSIPSLLFIPKDGLPKMAQGALQKNKLEEIINNLLLKSNAGI